MTSPSKHAVSAWSEFRHTKLYDLLAGLPLTAWFGFSAVRLFEHAEGELERAQASAFDSIAVVSLLGKAAGFSFVALLLVLMIIRHPASARAKGLLPRLCAFMGTYLALAVVWLPPQSIGFELSLLSLLLMLCGLGFAVYALAHLGRSFSMMAEARRLVVDGPYARIRHPLYLGEAVATLGLMLQFLSAFALLIFSLQLTFQLIRIRNEELVLAEQFPEYGDYKMRTARLFPGLY
jgi:protein-S-isoprenylcysteine O-methyltransferase Ste14